MEREMAVCWWWDVSQDGDAADSLFEVICVGWSCVVCWRNVKQYSALPTDDPLENSSQKSTCLLLILWIGYCNAWSGYWLVSSFYPSSFFKYGFAEAFSLPSWSLKGMGYHADCRHLLTRASQSLPTCPPASCYLPAKLLCLVAIWVRSSFIYHV